MGSLRDHDDMACALSVFEMTPDDCLTWDEAFSRLHACARRCGYRASSGETVSQFAARRVQTYHHMIWGASNFITERSAAA